MVFVVSGPARLGCDCKRQMVGSCGEGWSWEVAAKGKVLVSTRVSRLPMRPSMWHAVVCRDAGGWGGEEELESGVTKERKKGAQTGDQGAAAEGKVGVRHTCGDCIQKRTIRRGAIRDWHVL